MCMRYVETVVDDAKTMVCDVNYEIQVLVLFLLVIGGLFFIVIASEDATHAVYRFIWLAVAVVFFVEGHWVITLLICYVAVAGWLSKPVSSIRISSSGRRDPPGY